MVSPPPDSERVSAEREPDRQRVGASPTPPVVSVLLPLRLETRFGPPSGADGWKLRVRVVPDAASIDRHDPDPTDDELDDVEALWRACGGDLATERGRVEWSRFAARRGPARAAWLARTFPPVPAAGGVTIDRPARLSPGGRPGRVAGLPPTLELWLARGGGAPTRVATLTVDQTQLTLDLADPATGREPWWSSFATAVAVGLGAELDLGAEADDIDALYVIGAGGGDPGPLFRAHRDSGKLAVLPIGTPTNTVDGAPAADLAKDPETWRALVLAGAAGTAGAQAVSSALTGGSGELGPLPGGAADHLELNQAMVAALWPAVFGHGLNDVLALPGTPEAGAWALDNLVPEGPFPPIRIDDQPFGLLPITDLAAWMPAPGDPAVEEAIRPPLLELRDVWAAAAEGRGTAVGADTDRLLGLIAQTPWSTGYSYRWFLPLYTTHALGHAVGAGVSSVELNKWWDQAAALPLTQPVPTAPYTAYGYLDDLKIPLVEPDNLGEFEGGLHGAISRLVGLPPGELAKAGPIPERGPIELFLGVIPNSLLLRLLVLALNRGDAGAALETNGQKSTLVEPAVADHSVPTLIAQWAQTPRGPQPAGPATRIADSVRSGALELRSFDVPTLERALTATLDTAAYRLDPWLTGFAWRRLKSLSAPRYDLGAYGWVDAPRPRAATGPSFPQEYLHAPSDAQVLTAAVLRDRALSDPEPERWQMDLRSDRVRLAEQLADEVRLGAHLSEALGRAVERAVGARADVERLRAAFPIRAEHGGRRACDGQAVLAQLASNPAALGLNPAQLAALAALAAALDAYGDLLVADAVHDVVSGRAALGASAMEAAAGLSAPPALDAIKTQRHGRGVMTTVVVALPVPPAPARTVDTAAAAPRPAGPVSPGRVADPAVAAFLDTAFGPANGPTWRWQVVDDEGLVVATVTLVQLGLAPVDTLSLSADDLAAAVLEQAPPGTVLPVGGLDSHARARRMADLLGSQPAVASDLAADGAEPADDSAVHTDLLARYTSLRSAAQAAITALATAVGGTTAQQQSALRDARRWGITPLTLDDPDLATRVGRARDALTGRLQAGPDAPAAAALSVVQLARTIAELASPEGKIPVLARHRLNTLPVSLSPEPAAPDPARTDLDPDWLEVVAAVRAPMARLEAFQLEQRTTSATTSSASLEQIPPSLAFRAWTNRPGDPWQAAPPAPEAPPGAPPALVPTTRMVAAFAPADVLDPGTSPDRPVALGLLDSWSETVPATDHATSVAFHVDAPGARAPQAILIAAPPALDVPLDTAALIGIVAEARALARVRAATPADLDTLSAALPLAWLPQAGTTGVIDLGPF